MGTVALIVEALQASAQLAPIIAAGYNQLKQTFSASDQASIETAIAGAYAKLEADVARVEAED